MAGEEERVGVWVAGEEEGGDEEEGECEGEEGREVGPARRVG